MNGWEEIIKNCYSKLDIDYRDFLEKDKGYFPKYDNIFNAFKTLPLNRTKYILFGQDPYPRKESAIGYAFIDAKVKNIFDKTNGLSKEVNRAVSLRNFIKMALVAEGRLNIEDTSKDAIKKIDKDGLIDTIFDLKDNFEKSGVLLLNRALIFTNKKDSKKHLKKWQPFIKRLLEELKNRDIEIILFGKSDIKIDCFKVHQFEHPYNHSFISNKKAIEFFKPMRLLIKN